LKHLVLQSPFKSALIAFIFLLCVNAGEAADLNCANPQGTVARAIFTTDIIDREPVNQVLILDSHYKKIYFFTDLRHFEGQDIVHRWEHDGHVVSQKTFSVKGPRWRVFSSLSLDDSMTGRWTGIITDKNGCPIKAVVFQYVPADSNGDGSAIINLKASQQ